MRLVHDKMTTLCVATTMKSLGAALQNDSYVCMNMLYLHIITYKCMNAYTLIYICEKHIAHFTQQIIHLVLEFITSINHKLECPNKFIIDWNIIFDMVMSL